MINTNYECAVVMIDTLGTVTHWNKEATALFGFDEQDMLGNSISGLMPAERGNQGVLQDILKKAAGQSCLRFKSARKKRNGDLFMADIYYTALFSDDDKLIGFTKTIREVKNGNTVIKNHDVSGWVTTSINNLRSKGSLDAAQEHVVAGPENKYRSLFTNNPLPLIFWDLETHHISDFNEAALMKYGYTAGEFLGLPIKNLWPNDDATVLNKVLKEQYPDTSGHSVFKFKRYHKTKAGTLIYVEIFGQYLNFNGKMAAFAMVNDITEPHYYHELERIEKELFELTTRSDKKLSEAIAIYLKGIEALHPGIVCAVMEVKGNKLFYIAAPTLPQAIKDEIEGVAIGEGTGSSATAAFTKQKVMVNNIAPDVHCKGKKEIASGYGLRSCWSYPLIDRYGVVMGVFAVFNMESNAFAGLKEKAIERSVNLLQIILESFKREQALSISNERFKYATEATSDVIWDWDLGTNQLYFSKNVEAVFGYKDAGIYNNINFYRDCIHPDDRNAVLIDVEEVRKSAKSKWDQYYRFKKASGEYAFVKDQFKIIRNENGLGLRLVGAMSDVSRQKQEEQRLKLFESVFARTKDVIIITEAEPLDHPGPRVLFVNEAFTATTGYLAEEIIGKTPRILQGAKTNMAELKRMSQLLRNWQPVEATLLNYKKNGEKFWVNLSIAPVADENGWYTHWVSIQRDVTKKKNEELQNDLLTAIGKIFNTEKILKECLHESMAAIGNFGNFGLTEFWMVDGEKNTVNFITGTVNSAALNAFSEKTRSYSGVVKGEGLIGKAWETLQVQYWNYQDDSLLPKRLTEAIGAGIKRAYAVPLVNDLAVIGVLVFHMDKDEIPDAGLADDLGYFSEAFTPKIIRKQVEDELNQLFNFAPDILCIINETGYFKKINPAMSALLGYSEQELLAAPCFNFLHPGDILKTKDEIGKVFENNTGLNFENRFMTKTGRLKWLSWTASQVAEDGLVYAVAKDISLQKELEILLHNATSLARIGAWSVDLNKRDVYWSKITSEIHEVGPNYKPDYDTVIYFYTEGISRDSFAKIMEEAVGSGTTGDAELEIITARGNSKWIRIIVEPEFVNGQCVRISGSFQDIDERKRIELALEESLNEKKEILESIGDAFYTVDKNWVVTYWNNMAAFITGIPAEKALGNNLWEVFPRAVNTESYKNYHLALETGQVKDFEQFYAHNGKSFAISVYPSKHGLAIYFKEITDRKAAEQKMLELNENLKKQAKELEISNAELEQFAYVASHDLQEPLRMVTSFLTQIEKKYNDVLDDKGKQYIHFAVDGAKRMRQIILDLLEFSRVGSALEEKETVYLDRVVREVEALYRRKIEETKAAIKYSNLPAVSSYKTPVREVLQNLISNALKYQNKGVKPVIEISCQEAADHWLIAVRDNGIGVDPVYFDKIFIIFQRLHNKDEYAGTGMGLAITKKIVENLGGKIWLQSEEGKGSTFYFTILKDITTQ